MSDIENEFNSALSRYKSGDDINKIAGEFRNIINKIPNHFAAWTCLAWLQLLCDQPDEALRSARFAVKLNPQDPQARINLSLALLETESKGVREHIQMVQQILTMAPQVTDDLRGALEDGLQRRPGWTSAEKVKNWLNF